MDILIFGTGSVSEYIYNRLDLDKIRILAFINTVDNGFVFHEIPVIPLEKIVEFKYDYIVIASGYVDSIKQSLLSANVPSDKIIAFIFDESSFYNNLAVKIDADINSEYHRDLIVPYLKSGEKLSHVFPTVFWQSETSIDYIEKDYVREQTVRLIANQMTCCGIGGDVAELGVFRGDFTVVLQREFPNRCLYLYDTFSGFSNSDISSDTSINNKVGENNKFKDTSASFVLNRLPNDSNVIINEGLFPETFDENIGKFCFVSIDFNLYSPVKSALELFYSHVSEGGYILVSDYNAPFYSGTHRAVDEFCEEYHLVPIPIADFYGSVLIQKRIG